MIEVLIFRKIYGSVICVLYVVFCFFKYLKILLKKLLWINDMGIFLLLVYCFLIEFKICEFWLVEKGYDIIFIYLDFWVVWMRFLSRLFYILIRLKFDNLLIVVYIYDYIILIICCLFGYGLRIFCSCLWIGGFFKFV